MEGSRGPLDPMSGWMGACHLDEQQSGLPEFEGPMGHPQSGAGGSGLVVMCRLPGGQMGVSHLRARDPRLPGPGPSQGVVPVGLPPYRRGLLSRSANSLRGDWLYRPSTVKGQWWGRSPRRKPLAPPEVGGRCRGEPGGGSGRWSQRHLWWTLLRWPASWAAVTDTCEVPVRTERLCSPRRAPRPGSAAELLAQAASLGAQRSGL